MREHLDNIKEKLKQIYTERVRLLQQIQQEQPNINDNNNNNNNIFDNNYIDKKEIAEKIKEIVKEAGELLGYENIEEIIKIANEFGYNKIVKVEILYNLIIFNHSKI